MKTETSCAERIAYLNRIREKLGRSNPILTGAEHRLMYSHTPKKACYVNPQWLRICCVLNFESIKDAERYIKKLDKKIEKIRLDNEARLYRKLANEGPLYKTRLITRDQYIKFMIHDKSAILCAIEQVQGVKEERRLFLEVRGAYRKHPYLRELHKKNASFTQFWFRKVFGWR